MTKITLIIFALFILALNGQAAKQYYVWPELKSFVGAMLSCKTSGMRLASIESEEINKAVNSSVVNSTTHSRNGYWIGGAALTFDALGWYWIETGTKMTYTNWGSNQPNYVETDAETGYCVRFGNFYGVNQTYKWENIDCNAQLYYICELDV